MNTCFETIDAPLMEKVSCNVRLAARSIKPEKKIAPRNFMQQQTIIDKWVYLFQMFETSFKKHKNLFSGISPNIIYGDFKKSLENILVISPETVTVGVSEDECVYIYFEKDNKSVYFDLFFEQEKPTEAAVTVFENKIPVLSITDYMDNSINTLKNEFGTKI